MNVCGAWSPAPLRAVEATSCRPYRTKKWWSAGAGVNQIDLEGVAARGILVTNTPDIPTDDVAD
ncbi:hypothetical protein [Fodinicurvata sediminis]|uniref:hypothetical protein n=1 Tax=Fodinicurvata sediminis TaxID=1121832 RepID=UPI00345FC2EF